MEARTKQYKKIQCVLVSFWLDCKTD